MIKGLYRSGSAMLPRIKQQETIANNLANASTAGFKKDMVFTQELTRAQAKNKPRQTDWETPMIDQVYTQYSQGDLDQTGNPLDLALEGNGFFVVEAEDGTPVLTRAGNFQVDRNGFVVNPEGQRLLSEGGPINIAEGAGEVSISENGQVEVAGDVIANVRVVTVEDPTQLKKAGNSGFALPEGSDPIPAINFAIRQGYLEHSNVETIKEMVEMIISFRNYEASANALKVQDDSLDKLLTNVARIR